MKNQTFYTRSEKDRPRLLDFVKRLPLDAHLVWKVEAEVATRSAQQNRLYWKWLGIIAKETGNEVSALHEHFKSKFLPPQTVTLKDEIFEVYTTKKLKIHEMSEYLNHINALANEYGIYLPIPEELHLRRTA